MKPFFITTFALKVPCAAETARDLDRRGIIHPERTPAGQRRFDDSDVDKARKYLASVGRLRRID